MKNELRVFFIRKPDYTSFGYITIPLHSMVTLNLRHLDLVSAKTGLSPYGLSMTGTGCGVGGRGGGTPSFWWFLEPLPFVSLCRGA